MSNNYTAVWRLYERTIQRLVPYQPIHCCSYLSVIHWNEITSLVENLDYECAQPVDITTTVKLPPINTIILAVFYFCRAMLLRKRGLCRHAVSVCLFVRPSVTFVDHVKTNKHIFEFFSPSGSHTIPVFPCQRWCRYSDGNPLTGTSNAGGYRQKSRFWSNSWLSKIAGLAK